MSKKNYDHYTSQGADLQHAHVEYAASFIFQYE